MSRHLGIAAFVLAAAWAVGANAVEAAPDAGANPLRAVAELMRQVERMLAELSDQRAAEKQAEVLDAFDRQLEAARRLQAELAERMDRLLRQARGGQQQILDQLDALIEQAERQTPPPAPPGPSAGPPRGARLSQTPATESTAPEGQTSPPVLDAARLPGRDREAVLSAWRQEFPDAWREMLQRYYSELGRLSRSSTPLP